MKLLMIIVDTECREEVEVLFQHNGVTGYSEIPNAHGVGATGVRMGSGAHPKTSSHLLHRGRGRPGGTAQKGPLHLLRRLQEGHADDPMGRRGSGVSNA